MNRIITTDISDPTIQQPFTGNSLDFIQDANKEVALANALKMIGDSYDNTKAYVLQGVYAYGTNQYKEGYILYGGEIYYTAGKASTTAFTNIPVMTITITNDVTADPITFSDGVSRNAHNVRRLVLSDAVSGSGDFDLADAIYLQDSIAYTPTLGANDSGGSPVVGGFTAGAIDCRYLQRENFLIIDVSLFSVSTLATSRTLTLTLPVGFTVQTSKLLTGTCVVNYNNGTNGIPALASIRLSSTGAGSGLEITKMDDTDFGAFSGGTMKFTLIAYML